MAKMRTIRLALLVFGMSGYAAAQSSSQSQPATTPAPAFGQNAPVLSPENPPVSGLDEPGLELHTASQEIPGRTIELGDDSGDCRRPTDYRHRQSAELTREI